MEKTETTNAGREPTEKKAVATSENGVIKPITPTFKTEYFTLDDLMTEKITPIEFTVDGLIPSIGLSAIVGKPKVGKSFMVADMAYQIVTGGAFIGKACEQKEVLYYALEDNKQRLKERFGKIMEEKERLPFHMSIKVPDLDHGFLSELDEFLKSHPNVKVVFIDTFKKVRGRSLPRENAYDWDYREAGALQQFAVKKEIAIILLHHLKKGQTVNDPTEDISGSNGLFGALDTALIIVKENRSDKTAKLYTIGRDIEEESYQIEFSDCKWKLLGLAEEYERQQAELEFRRSPIVKTITRLLGKNKGYWKGTASELMEEGKQITGQSIAPNSTALGMKLTKLSEQLKEYEFISYNTVSGKNGNKMHCFSSDNPFDVSP